MTYGDAVIYDDYFYGLRRAITKINLYERTTSHHGEAMQFIDVSLTHGDLIIAIRKKGTESELRSGDAWYEILCDRGIFWVPGFTLYCNSESL